MKMKSILAALAASCMMMTGLSVSATETAESETGSSEETTTETVLDANAIIESVLNGEETTDENTAETTATSYDNYFDDPYYDTEGNASLVKEQRIIHDSSEMQFISVTTRDGHVFYILIDYTAVLNSDSGEEAVYFLNKVDDYDLYSLIYASDDEDGEAANPVVQYENSITTTDVEDAALESDVPEVPEEVPNNHSSGGINPMIWIVFGATAVVFIAGYYILKIKPKKESAIMEDDFDMDMDDEIEE